jgi:hypothetical protein
MAFASPNPLSRRTYITLRPYNSDFFSYTTSTTPAREVVGALGDVSGATVDNCLKGAFLRETGKKLYPGVNPGVSTFMVGVFDYANSLHGFIDPNSPAFSPQNTDRSYILASSGYSPNTIDSGVGRSDQGPPVFTRGEIIAQSNLSIAGTADISGNTVIRPGNLFVSTGYANVNGNISTLTGNFVANAGTLYLNQPWVSSFSMGVGSQSGGYRRVTFTGLTGVTANSFVFLQNTSQNNVSGAYSVEGQGNGTFIVVGNNSNDASGMKYIVLNY